MPIGLRFYCIYALGAAAAEAVSRAIVRGVTQARSAGGVPGAGG